MSKTHRVRNPRKVWHVIWYAVLAGIFLIGNLPAVQASTLVEVGYRDFQFPTDTGSNGEVTAEKPESKLWWNDGFWWAGMWEKPDDAYHIFRLDVGTQTWVDTGTPIDNRSDTKMDTLWDGVHLYVVSHIWAGEGVEAATLAEQGRLYRYSYDSGSDVYSLDSDFPVEIGSGKTEALVVAKDTAGTLWITYAQKDPSDDVYKVWINHSIDGDDLNWREPYILPATDADNLLSDGDDISSIVAYGGRIGVMWSNQNTKHMYFAMHSDGDLDSNWASVGAYTTSADDHINLKSIQSDSAGSIFAVVKTSKNAALIVVLVCLSGSACTSAGNWSAYPVYTSGDESATRPDLLIDTDNRHLYVFTRNKDGNGDSGIYFKIADMDNIAFPAGLGVPFIKSSLDTGVNDPTSTKQNVNSTTGIVVLASDSGSEYYLHNYLALSASNQPVIYAFSPISGTVGTEVTLTGANFTGTPEVSFNGTFAISPTVDNDTQVRVTVPVGATTGPISLTTASGTDTSADDFTVLYPPEITSFNPNNGSVGTLVTLTGNNFTGTTAVAFNVTNAPGFIVDSNTQIRVNVPTGATTGPISVTNPSGTDVSSTEFTVTQGPLIISFDPASGVVDATVTLTGENFTEATEVRFFDGVVDSSFVVESDTQITAHVPSGATTGPISVTNPAGTGTSASDFYVIVSPSIGSFNPVSGPVGTLVTLTGSGFTGVTILNFNGVADSTFSVDSDTQISAHVPSGATTGPISVTNLAGSDTSIDDFTVIKTPTITSFDPMSGPVGTVVRISGSDFTGTTDVSFGGTSASIYAVDNDNQITANVPLGAVSGKITVENAAGVGTSVDNFNVTVTLTVHIQGSGSVTLSPLGGVYDVGTDVTLTPVPGSGWGFSSWSGDLTGSANPGLIHMDGDKTVTATFDENSLPQFYLTAIPIGKGTVSFDPPGGVYQAGTVVTMTANADPGWEFSSWSGDLDGATNPAEISMDADKTVFADFTEQTVSQYSLTVTTSGVGSVILDPPGGIYNAGTVVKLTAMPAVGWAFNGWGGDLSGTKNPENILMDGNKSVILTFNQVGEVRMLFIPGVMKSNLAFSP